MPNRFFIPVVMCTAIVLLAVLSVLGLQGTVGGLARAVSAYILVMLLPGAAFYLVFARRIAVLDLALHMLLSSPLLATAVAVIAMLAGASSGTAALAVLAASALITAAVVLAGRGLSIGSEITRGQAAVLVVAAGALCAIAGYLPLSSEWWRMHSDAWFHAAVVAEIDTFGLPPEDPYFAGLPLQYMWYYHALILLIAKTANIDPFIVMPIVNLQALAGFVVATLLFSLNLASSGRRFSFAIASVLVAVLGMNALFWLFEPLKLIRAFTGDITGLEEVRRSFSLAPFDKYSVRHFLGIYHNQVFFLDKFIISTAFSLALAYMAAFWYAAASYLANRERHLPALLAVSTAGMLLFHSLTGFIMLAGLAGGLALLFAMQRLVNGYSFRRSLALAAAALAGCVVSAPYLYAIMHGKEPSNVTAFGFTAAKFIGVFISCALVLVLAPFQVRKLLRGREPQELFLLLAAACITLFCLALNLPGSNAFDKLPFFIFHPLAVIGAWTLLDWSERRRQPARRRAFAVALFFLLLVPVNVLATLGYYRTRTLNMVSPAEQEVSEWAQERTARDALFIDSEDRVFLLVTGPRRYYWGKQMYADLWGYGFEEMAKRKHVRDNLYSNDPIDLAVFETLSSIDGDLYIIVREPDGGAASRPDERTESRGPAKKTRPPAGMEKFSEYPALFDTVFSAWPITVLRVDRAACRDWVDLLMEAQENR